MTDRRRINGPPSGTQPPVFAAQVPLPAASTTSAQHPTRSRRPNELRKIFLRTGLTPSASGSAYLELLNPDDEKAAKRQQNSIVAPTSSLKITCAVHGPRPLPRSAPFSPQLVLSTHVKFAPFAARSHRRGFVRDAVERDLGAHLETALRGVVIGDRWPKSGVDVIVTVLEAEDDSWWLGGEKGGGGVVGGPGAMSVLAGCITVASAAMLEAGIDCVDIVTGGVAAVVGEAGDRSSLASRTEANGKSQAGESEILLDPCPAEHDDIKATCVVAYLASRDELTEVWMKGDLGAEPDALVDRAVEAARGARKVLTAVLKESTDAKMAVLSGDDTSSVKHTSQAKEKAGKAKMDASSADVEMDG